MCGRRSGVTMHSRWNRCLIQSGRFAPRATCCPGTQEKHASIQRNHTLTCAFMTAGGKQTKRRKLDRNYNVRAWVKNDHIGFEITYSFKGIIHKFRPDYLIKLTHGTTVVLEVKGMDDQQNKTKRVFLSEWVQAVNLHGGFGKWAADVSRHPKDVLEILEKHNAATALFT